MHMVVLFWGLLYVHSTQCMSQTSQHLLQVEIPLLHKQTGDTVSGFDTRDHQMAIIAIS